MKKGIFAVTATLLIIFSLAYIGFRPFNSQTNIPATASASWSEHYESLEDMTKAANLVVVGTVVGSSAEKRVDLIFTRQKIQIDKVISGSGIAVGDNVEVLQTGGNLNGEVTQAIQEDPLLKQNSKHLLFLRLAKDNPGLYLKLGGFQGRAEVGADGLLRVNVEDGPIGKALHKQTLTSVLQEIESKKR